MRRLASSQNFVLIAPSKQQVPPDCCPNPNKQTERTEDEQVAGQRAMEALPLVMEPESRM
jgi:hypothetical protein